MAPVSLAADGQDLVVYLLAVSSICVMFWIVIGCACCKKREDRIIRSAMSNLQNHDDVPPPPLPESPAPKRGPGKKKPRVSRFVVVSRKSKQLEKKPSLEREPRHKPADQRPSVDKERKENPLLHWRLSDLDSTTSTSTSSSESSSTGRVKWKFGRPKSKSSQPPTLKDALDVERQKKSADPYVDLSKVWDLTILKNDRRKKEKEARAKRKLARIEKVERDKMLLVQRLNQFETPVVRQGIDSHASHYKTFRDVDMRMVGSANGNVASKAKSEPESANVLLM